MFYRTPSTTPVRRVERLKIKDTRRRERPLQTWRKRIKKDTLDCRVTDNMINDKVNWRRKTHKVDPK